MPLTYDSLCDGIGAVHVAWQPLGWRCAWVSETEPFSDDHTLVEYWGKPAADEPRYWALGNSMAAPVMAWIGKRVRLVDGLLQERTPVLEGTGVEEVLK